VNAREERRGGERGRGEEGRGGLIDSSLKSGLE